MDETKGARFLFFINLILLLSILFNLSLVSAQASSSGSDELVKSVEKTLGQIVNVLEPIFKAVVGFPQGAGAGELSMRVLAFVLVLLVVYGALQDLKFFSKSTGEPNAGLNFAIGAVVALIGIRFLPSGFLRSMTLPANAFIALIVVIIPMGLIFYATNKFGNHRFAVRAVWAIYAAILIVLFAYNWVENTGSNFATWGLAVYPIGAILSGLFILFGDSVYAAISRESVIDNLDRATKARIHHAEQEIDTVRKRMISLATDHSSDSDFKEKMEELKKQDLRLNELIDSLMGSKHKKFSQSILWIILAILLLGAFAYLVYKNIPAA